jgi:hypothetical protein
MENEGWTVNNGYACMAALVVARLMDRQTRLGNGAAHVLEGEILMLCP